MCETNTTVVPLWMRSRSAAPDFCWNSVSPTAST